MSESRAIRALTDIVAVEEYAPLYQRESWLQLQIDKGLEHERIGELCGVAGGTITKWAGRFGLQRREYDNDAKYHDAEWLSKKYHDEGLTQLEMAELAGVAKSTISHLMARYDIEAKDGIHWNRTIPASYCMTANGYLRWESTCGGEKDTVRVHRLLAVAEHGFDAVCGMDVHHKNGVKWDNRPDNIEIMSHGEHTAHHNRRSEQ